MYGFHASVFHRGHRNHRGQTRLCEEGRGSGTEVSGICHAPSQALPGWLKFVPLIATIVAHRHHHLPFKVPFAKIAESLSSLI